MLILEPHPTDRLQPLDVSLFSPLARYYTNGLDTLISSSLGYNNICTRTFWRVFWLAWNHAFSTATIASVWAKIGFFPLDPDVVLFIITKPGFSILEQGLKTPITVRAVRRFQKVNAATA